MRNKIHFPVALCAVLLTSPALAADLVEIDAVEETPAIVVYDWTGLRIGASVGYEHYNQEMDLFGLLTLDSDNGKGVFGEVWLGYDFDLANNWVAGIGADYRFGDSEANFNLAGITIDITADHGYDLYGRLGYKLTTTSLLYGLGGYASQHFDLETNLGFADDYTLHGWTAGTGFETAINDKVTAKIEYRYADFDAYDIAGAGLVDITPTSHSVRFGLSFKLY